MKYYSRYTDFQLHYAIYKEPLGFLLESIPTDTLKEYLKIINTAHAEYQAIQKTHHIGLIDADKRAYAAKDLIKWEIKARAQRDKAPKS